MQRPLENSYRVLPGAPLAAGGDPTGGGEAETRPRLRRLFDAGTLPRRHRPQVLGQAPGAGAALAASHGRSP